MSKFLQRRAEQLEQSPEALAHRAKEASHVSSQIVAEEGAPAIEVGRLLDPAEVQGTVEHEDNRTLDEVLYFVRGVLGRLSGSPQSSNARGNAEKVIRKMTLQEREDALHAASEDFIQKKPAYYTALLASVERVGNLFPEARTVEDMFDEVLPSLAFIGDATLRGRVAAMSRRELRETVHTMTAQDLLSHPSFYHELLLRLKRGE